MPMKTEELATFEEFQAKLARGKPTVVFLFWTECGYCEAIAPFFEEQFQNKNHRHIEFFRLDKESDLGKKFRADYSIKAYPRFLVFNVPNVSDISVVPGRRIHEDNTIIIEKGGDKQALLSETLAHCCQ
ncbi:hypothetical protein TWF730_007141 [Orbilia blumenaviensis]|uniref:Thioredoxin domain-containing protein n=1 Tax=Orbilia blumenaviensis TaxID=1796055 RepID=A0AAV9VGC9_9PEZI